MERIKAKYLIETPFPLEKVANVIAGEQSSGTFIAVPGETEALKRRFAARVENILPLNQSAEPALPGAEVQNHKYQRAIIEISWSIENFGMNLPVMVSTLQGNLYEIKEFTGIRLMDITLPEAYGQQYRGPAFGISGTRKITCVQEDKPLIGTIIKPSLGMDPKDTAKLVKKLSTAGIDFVKDDELMGSPANSPFDERVKTIMEVINRHADKTGKKVMYAFNISDEWDDMQRHYDTILNHGGNAAMVSINSVGISATKAICDKGNLVIHAHRNGWGMLTRHPFLGMDFRAYQKIWRLVGVDQIHVNGIQNKFWETDDSMVSSIEDCLSPLFGGFQVLPVISSGQWGGQAMETYRRTRSTDFLYMAGGGIMAHPNGPEGGVQAIREAWEAAIDGLSMEEAVAKYPQFELSVKKFGNGNK